MNCEIITIVGMRLSWAVSVMGEYENNVRAAIERRFGSVPKMAAAIGLPKTTIYHALDRGLDNTTTRTRQAILEPLFDTMSANYPAKPLLDDSYIDERMPIDERQALDLFRALSADDRRLALEMLGRLAM